MADGHSKYMSLPESKAKYRQYISKAAESFQAALRLDPHPLYRYFLGFMCINLDRKAEALQHLQIVAEGDDADLAIKARKEMGRIGPVSAPALPTSGTGKVASAGGMEFVSRKVPNWGEVTKGGIALVIGVLTAGLLIGIPIALWGIYMVAKGFIVQVDV